jgi:hypothetical protein
VIDQLQMLTPDPARTERVRALCHKKLAPPKPRHLPESALLAGFSVIYLSFIALTVIEVFLVG